MRDELKFIVLIVNIVAMAFVVVIECHGTDDEEMRSRIKKKPLILDKSSVTSLLNVLRMNIFNILHSVQ